MQVYKYLTLMTARCVRASENYSECTVEKSKNITFLLSQNAVRFSYVVTPLTSEIRRNRKNDNSVCIGGLLGVIVVKTFANVSHSIDCISPIGNTARIMRFLVKSAFSRLFRVIFLEQRERASDDRE